MPKSKIAYILKGYPRLSETFISQEIALLEESGLDLEIFSLRQAREPERHPLVGKIKAPVTYIPEYWKDAPRDLMKKNIFVFLRMPLRYTKTFYKSLHNSIRSRSKSALKRFFQAAWLMETKHLGCAESPIAHIHTHFLHSPTELGLWLANLSGLTYSISAHAKDIYTNTDWEITQRIEGSEFLMTCTEHNVHYLRALPKLSERGRKKIHKVYHGISTELFSPSSLPYSESTGRYRLLTCARLVEKKGFPYMFQAVAELRNRGYPIYYEIYGSGELLKSFQAQCVDLGISEYVSFYGNITQGDLIQKYKEKGIFILACHETEDGDRDGIPNSLAEAMSMEIPVVATNISGIPELVENGKSGILVEAKNWQALSDAIEEILQNPMLGDSLGREARERVKFIFESRNCIHTCKELLEPFARSAAR